jgi:Niemann-Pick C1 protein
MPIGLDQTIALPSDSYLIPYFNQMNEYLLAGSPMFIVFRGGFNYTDPLVQNQICALEGCNDNSVANLYDQTPYILDKTLSWMDSYLSWANDPSCCLFYPNGTECIDATDRSCTTCFVDLDFSNGPTGRPQPDQFYQYLPWFFDYQVTNSCAHPGIAYNGDVIFDENGTAIASRLRNYHDVLITQDDYIDALSYAYQVANDTGMNIFPYSVWYVYFEQYLNIRSIAVMDISLALGSVFVVTLILLGNPWMSILITTIVLMVTVNLLGVMDWLNISLNAVSVVNLVMCVGISVEFCVHIAHSFTENHGTLEDRSIKALVKMGSSGK